MIVEMKFRNKHTYDPKFVWVNLEARSIGLSEYSYKDRRQKEVDFAEISEVIAGLPDKYEVTVDGNGDPIPLNPDHYLSIGSHRGGGIDLPFFTKQDRDIWYQVFNDSIFNRKSGKR